ncbi:MAG: hypothetical protein P0Y66_01655 [Candidatus Kaistia colombiensis]|nr:MAG: hypothetical protein P0Y66_01655 [Kaistia sp.]
MSAMKSANAEMNDADVLGGNIISRLRQRRIDCGQLLKRQPIGIIHLDLARLGPAPSVRGIGDGKMG